MTYKDLAIKILNLDTDFLNKEVSEQELFDLIDNSDTLDLEIKSYSALPCSLEVFKINGQDADVYDFGEGCSDGSCMEGACCHKFFVNENPDNKVLEKYGITEAEYFYIAEELSSRLYVVGCGLCS